VRLVFVPINDSGRSGTLQILYSHDSDAIYLLLFTRRWPPKFPYSHFCHPRNLVRTSGLRVCVRSTRRRLTSSLRTNQAASFLAQLFSREVKTMRTWVVNPARFYDFPPLPWSHYLIRWYCYHLITDLQSPLSQETGSHIL
jgi:hypothetical protein